MMTPPGPLQLQLMLLIACVFTIQVSGQEVKSADLKTEIEKAGFSVTSGKFGEFVQHNFQMEGIRCIIVRPEKPAEGFPWIWRARFWGHQSQLDQALLKQGWHVCYCDVGGLFGADEALNRWDKFYALSQNLGLHSMPFLEGMSRGGLIIMRWASAYPDQVLGIYADNAVMDMRSWPGGKGTGKGSPPMWQQCLKVHELTEAQAAEFKDGPLDRLEPLAKARVPIFVLINEADDVVPPAENGDLLVAGYKKLNGPIQEMRRPKRGHHPHSLKDPAPLVEFALEALKGNNENRQ